jgi:hypothetical protein
MSASRDLARPPDAAHAADVDDRLVLGAFLRLRPRSLLLLILAS